MAYVYKTIASPVGQLKLVASATGLAAVLWENDKPGRVRLGMSQESRASPALEQSDASRGGQLVLPQETHMQRDAISKHAQISSFQEDAKHPVLQETERQLQQYFNGELRTFDLPLDFKGTEFQNKVWCALLTIPFGETRSYGHIAEQIGHPSAVRAVGAASGKNPLSIVVPCHRVIGSNGKLTGFAGGLFVKAYLLGVESPHFN